MKHDDIHQAALRATARIALSLTVLSCGGRVQFEHEESETEPTPPTVDGPTTGPIAAQGAGGGGGRDSWTTGGGGEGGVSAPTICSAAPPGEVVALDAPAFACCAGFLGGTRATDWQLPTPELYACCNEVVGQIDLDPSLASNIEPSLVAPVWPETEGDSCCDLLGNPCTFPCGCTVWGPPVPRSLRGRLRSLEQLEIG